MTTKDSKSAAANDKLDEVFETLEYPTYDKLASISRCRARRKARMTPEDWVNFATNAAMETCLEISQKPGLSLDDAITESGASFRNNMPRLTSLNEVRGYIACVAAGVLCGWISSEVSVSMMNAATAAVAAFSAKGRGK